MITCFRDMNITSKDPKRLVVFYRDKLGISVIEEDENFDGVSFGNGKDAPVFCIWDENKWGKSNDGTVCLVFGCDDHEKTYLELKSKDINLDPPKTAVWGGRELYVKDPDGNTILIL